MIEVNHECYVDLEVAKLLKKAGFDWKVNHRWQNWNNYADTTPFFLNALDYYEDSNDDVSDDAFSAPTLDVAQRWLREVKGFEIFVGFTKHDFGNGNEKAYFYDCYEIPENEDAFEHFDDIYYHLYEEAQEAGIKKALEIILRKGE